MPQATPNTTPSDWDQLVARPPEPLRMVLDPSSAEARGAPADPKPVHPKHSRDPVDEKPADAIERSA